MARMCLNHMFTDQLKLEDVQALAPDILEAVRTRCPADTMFGNEIRMAGFRALTKYRFKEGIEAGVLFAKTQGGHGSENRTGEIMQGIVSYGSAAREAIPGMRELIAASAPSRTRSKRSKPRPDSPSCGAFRKERARFHQRAWSPDPLSSLNS